MYILAFIGAVVMLFLSIVLMLPASTTSASTQNTSVVLLTVVETNSSVTGFGVIEIAVFIILYTSALVMVGFLHREATHISRSIKILLAENKTISGLIREAVSAIRGVI